MFVSGGSDRGQVDQIWRIEVRESYPVLIGPSRRGIVPIAIPYNINHVWTIYATNPGE